MRPVDRVIRFATEALFENFRISDDLLAGKNTFSTISPPSDALSFVLPDELHVS